MPSPSTPPPTRTRGLAGIVISVAALGIALSVVVLVLSEAFGGHSTEHAPADAPPTPAAAAQADQGGPSDPDAYAGQGGMQDMGGMHGEGSGGLELYAVQTGPLGVVVTDGQGRLLYGSEKDANNPPTSRCVDACAQEWLPLVVPAGQEPQLLGVDADKVGRLARADGTSQLTLGGWPVYVNRNDDGQVEGAAPDAHGAWFVMTPQGEKKAV